LNFKVFFRRYVHQSGRVRNRYTLNFKCTSSPPNMSLHVEKEAVLNKGAMLNRKRSMLYLQHWVSMLNNQIRIFLRQTNVEKIKTLFNMMQQFPDLFKINSLEEVLTKNVC